MDQPIALNVVQGVSLLNEQRALEMKEPCIERAKLFSRERFLAGMEEIVAGVRGWAAH